MNTRRPSPSLRQRPASPHCRGGVSSLLRLSQASAGRLPAPGELSAWMDRAAGKLVSSPR